MFYLLSSYWHNLSNVCMKTTNRWIVVSTFLQAARYLEYKWTKLTYKLLVIWNTNEQNSHTSW